MFEFLVVGDLHLDRPRPYKDYLKTTCDILRSILDYAVENGIKVVIILGDLFHTPYPSDESKIELLRILEEYELEFHVILGNHDWSSTENNSAQLLNYLTESKYTNLNMYIVPTCKKIGNLRFQFLPFPHEKPISDKPSVCISHASYDGFTTDNGRPVKGTKLDRRHKWYVGHIHTRQKDVYPGSIIQNTFGESNDKYFFHVFAESQSNITTKAITIPQPYELKKIIIRQDSDFDELVSDEHIYYKLDVKNDVVVPIDLEDRFNIVDTSFFRKESELEVSGELVLSKEEQEIADPTRYLGSFLKKKGIDSKGCKRAKLLINKIERTINNGKESKRSRSRDQKGC